MGKIKGSSFFVWFLVGLCLPGIGLLAAILYRFEDQEPRRRCPRCGTVRPIADQVCTVCGEDMDWPEPEEVVPAPPPLSAKSPVVHSQTTGARGRHGFFRPFCGAFPGSLEIRRPARRYERRVPCEQSTR